jgi:hypothetical protein
MRAVLRVPTGIWRIFAASALIAGLSGMTGVSAGNAVAAARPTAAAAGGARASGGTWGAAGQIPGLSALATRHIAEVFTMSCASPGNCGAGGLYVTPANGSGGEAFVANQTGGVWGQAEEVPGMASLELGDGGAAVDSISCPSVGTCGAGGEYVDSTGGQQAFVADEVNGVWGTAEEAPGTAALNTGNGAGINAVSCGSPGNCSAVGQYSDGALVPLDQVFAIDEVNGTWGSAQPIPGTVALNTGQDANVTALSCPTPGNCGAGGYYADASGHWQAFVVSEVNGTWGTAIEVPGTAALNHRDASINSVSCASPGNCSAGGYYSQNSRLVQAFAVSEISGVWGTAREVPGTGTLNAGGSAQVSSVSCPSAGNCSAAGDYTDASHNGQPFVVSQVGGTWRKAEQVPGTATLSGGGGAGLSQVSCASPGNCGAVGAYFVPCTGTQCLDQQALVVSEVNGTWGNAIEVPKTATLNGGNDAATNAVSCTAPGKCSAGGFYSVNGASERAFVVSER